jgi:hypothetical protein
VDSIDDTAAGTKKPNAPKDALDAASDLLRAVIRGTAKGCGRGLTALGEELEKFGEQLSRPNR